jgi:predicted ATPase
LPYALETLTRLRASSLLSLQEHSGEVRFSMLEVLRQWAVEQLPRTESDRLSEHYLNWFEQFILTGATHQYQPGESQWTERLKSDRANLRQTLTRTQEEDPARMARLAAKLAWFWETTGALEEGMVWLEAALPHAENDTVRAEILYGQSF